jgi:hypothetical protein
MDLILDRLKNPWVAGVLGVIVGLLLGLLVGYVIVPVEWVNVPMEWNKPEIQEDYLRMAIDAYKLDFDTTKAGTRWAELGTAGPETLAKIEADMGALNSDDILSYKQATGADVGVGVSPTESTEEGGSNTTFLLVMCLVTLIVGGALAAYFLFRPKQSDTLSPAAEALKVTNQMEQTDFGARDGTPPMQQFMTTYMLGDDLFDDSFSIDSPTGEFLGECGVGISEAIGVGEPKKVTAFEVWLFDKNDIQTITKVLMSQHAFADGSLRGRLAAKGDPFLVEPGGETVLETETLRLIARVVDMAYGTGASPTDSFFERVTLELAVWQKDEQSNF